MDKATEIRLFEINEEMKLMYPRHKRYLELLALRNRIKKQISGAGCGKEFNIKNYLFMCNERHLCPSCQEKV